MGAVPCPGGLSSVPGLRPLDASGTFAVVTTTVSPGFTKWLLGTKMAPVENYWPRPKLGTRP